MTMADLVLSLLLLGAPAPAGGSAAGTDVRGRADNQEVIVGRYRLKPKASGGYRAETDQFIAWIAADGAVNFENRPRLPGPAVLPAIILGQVLQARSSARSSGTTGDPKRQVTSPSLVLADDDLRDDPFHGQKMAFLDETADFREQLQRRNDTAALRAFRAQVDAAATDRAHDPRQRRRNLFELWLECDETARGAPARAVVEQVIRRRFPAKSPDAYSAQELAALRARVGRGLRFDPYAVHAEGGHPPPSVPPPAPAPAPRK